MTTTAKRNGRPPKLTSAIIMEICEAIANGETLTAAAKKQNVVPSTVRYQLMKDEQLFAASTRARESGCDALADQCIEIADDATLDPAQKRIMVETRIRLIGKWSKRYSDKVTVTNETTVTHRYDLDNLPQERLDELERILAFAERSEGSLIEAQPTSLH